MAEEQEKSQKPKAKLIKHRKPDPQKLPLEPKPDKKKVVVVKKKAKKTASKAAVQHQEAPNKKARSAAQDSSAPASARSSGKTKPPQKATPGSGQKRESWSGEELRTQSNQDRSRSTTHTYRRGTENRPLLPSGPRLGGSRFSSAPKYSRGYKNPSPPPPMVKRMGGPGEGTPRSGAPGRPRMGDTPRGGISEIPTTDTRSPGKKFFKTKKSTYKKKKDPSQKERDFQIKKKNCSVDQPSS